MSTIGELKLSKQTVEAHRTVFEAQTQKLEDVKKEIRQIDPQLLGEKRYEDNAHWRVTKLVYDFCYLIKDLFKFSKIKELTATKTNFEAAVTLTGNTLRGYEDAHEMLTSSTVVQQEAAVNHVTKALADLKEVIKSTTYRWPISLVVPTENMERRVATLESNKALFEQCLADTLEALDEKAVEVSPFDKLKISDEEKKQIRILFPSVANDTVLQLIPKLRQIFAAKAKLEPLHPLKSMEDILKDKGLRENFLKIKSEKEKWIGRDVFLWGFVPGFVPNTAEKLKKYHEQGAIVPCLPGFALSLGLTQEQQDQLTTQATAGKWEDFVESLAAFAPTLK